MTSKQSIATEAFRDGYNCAQAVLFAFAPELDIDIQTLSRLAAGLGGGMGRLQRTCGAVSGGIMVLGALYNEPYLELGEKKDEMTSRIRNLVFEFENQFGTSSCKELIGVDLITEKGREEAKQRNLYETHCLQYINRTIEILERRISKMEDTANP